MHSLAFFLLFASPFWDELPPKQWTSAQITELMTDSPWAVTTYFQNQTPAHVYLASAKPIREAEAELLRRLSVNQGPGAAQQILAAREEYDDFLKENEGKVVVIAIPNPNAVALSDAEEAKRMVEETYMKVGRKKIKMTGHFPPSDNDNNLRFVFPRPDSSAKELNFELYIPGFTGPYRQAEFKMKSLVYKGKTEM